MIERILRAMPAGQWLLLGAGMVLTAAAAALVLIVWMGGWSEVQQEQQLWYLGVSLLCVLALIAIVIVAISGVGVRGKGPAGIEFDLDPSDAPGIVTTISATVEKKTETKGPDT